MLYPAELRALKLSYSSIDCSCWGTGLASVHWSITMGLRPDRYAILRHIQTLDPERDHQRICHS